MDLDPFAKEEDNHEEDHEEIQANDEEDAT